MIKVCSPQLGLSPDSHLGGEVYDFEIIQYLLSRNIKVEILLPKNRPFKANRNLTVEFLPITPVAPPHLFNLLAIPYLHRKYQQTKFDILRVHSPYFLGFAAWQFKKLHPEVKIVTDILLKEDRVDLDFILSQTKDVYDHFFVLTNYLKKWLITKYQIDPKKITIIYGGVSSYLQPTSKDSKLVKQYDLKNKFILLNVGLLIDRKNVLFLIDVLKVLIKKYPNLVLIFCGTGSQRQTLLAKIRQLGLEKNVIIQIPIYGAGKNKIYNLADIFLFPTKSEGFGLVAAEAMACGKPVIAANNSCLPEVVDNNQTGLLAKTNDVNDWVKKISILIDDPKLRKKMGLQSRKKAKKDFSWDAVGQKVYEAMINLR